MRSANHTKKLNRPITILSLDVGRGASAHEIALNQAFQSLVDVILIQEPYIFRDLSRRITKRHRSYETFCPHVDWSTHRPRVVSYVRKELSSHAEQIYIGLSRDLLLLRLTSPTDQILNIFNVYNAPHNDNNESALQTLYTLPRSLFQGSCFLQGDFNLHHIRWQPSWPRGPSTGAEEFVEWADNRNFSLLSPLDKAIHNRGNVLD